MSEYRLDDDLLLAVRAARPAVPAETVSPTGAAAEVVLERVLASDRRRQGLSWLGPRGRRHRSARWARLRGRLRATTAGLAVLVSIVVTVLIAAVVLTAFKHGHASISGPSASSSSASRRELIQTLGALRRRQTKADRMATLPSPFYIPPDAPPSLQRAISRQNQYELKGSGYPRIDRTLVRMMPTAAGDEISIVPETWRPSPRSARRSEGLTIAIHTPGNQQAVDTGPVPVSVPYFRAHGLAVFNDTRRGVLVVPDGVARVTLRGLEDHLAHSRQPISFDNSQVAGKSSVVHHNIATFTLAGLTATSRFSGDLGAAALARVTWPNAAGDVIANTTTQLEELYITVRRTAVGARTAPGAVEPAPVSPASVAAPLSLKALAVARYCDAPAMRLVSCQPGQRSVSAAPQRLVELSFTARRATGPHSWYAWDLTAPRACQQSSDGGHTLVTVKAGTRLVFDDLMPPACHGTVTATATYISQSPTIDSEREAPVGRIAHHV